MEPLAGMWAGLVHGQIVSGSVDSAIESYRQVIHVDPRYADLA